MSFRINSVVLRQSHQRRKKKAALLMLIIINKLNEGHENFERTCWVKPWIGRRRQQGVHHNLFTELQLEDSDKFRRYVLLHFIRTF